MRETRRSAKELSNYASGRFGEAAAPFSPRHSALIARCREIAIAARRGIPGGSVARGECAGGFDASGELIVISGVSVLGARSVSSLFLWPWIGLRLSYVFRRDDLEFRGWNADRWLDNLLLTI